MSALSRFPLATLSYGALCVLSLAVSDYDFREAVYWEDRESALLWHGSGAFALSLLFGALIAGRTDFGKTLARLAVTTGLGVAVALIAGWIVAAPAAEDPTYRWFLARIYPARALRYMLCAIPMFLLIQAAAAGRRPPAAARRERI